MTAAAAQTSEDELAKIVTMRDAIATRIKDLSQRWAENTIAIGQEFRRARDSFPSTQKGNDKSARPGWYDWISENTEWSRHHVARFVRIAEKFDGHAMSIDLGVGVLNYLAQSTVPDGAVDDVIASAKRGERITVPRAKEIAKPHLPTRAAAIKQARDTGKLVAARDGNLYSGASEDEMAAYSERREVVYSVRRAAACIADCQFTPSDFVKAAEDHWLTEFKLGHVDAAIKWLTKLKPILEKKQGVIDGRS